MNASEYVAQGATEGQAEVLTLKDEGLTNQAIADRLGKDARTVSNLYTGGLRRIGRGNEVATPSQGGRKAKVPAFIGYLQAILGAVVKAEAEVAEAKAEADEDPTPKAVVDRRVKAIEDRIAALNAEAEGLKGNSDEAKAARKALVEAEATRRKARVEAATKALETVTTEATAEMAEAGFTLEEAKAKVAEAEAKAEAKG